MRIWKYILKIIFLPVLALLMLIGLFAEYVAGIARMLFRMLAYIIFMVAILSMGFGLESIDECIYIVSVRFVFYLLPCFIEGVVIVTVVIREWIHLSIDWEIKLRNWERSKEIVKIVVWFKMLWRHGRNWWMKRNRLREENTSLGFFIKKN